MEIFINDIPEEGLTIELDSKQAPWLENLLKELSGENFAESDRAHLSATLLNCDENVDIRGELTILNHPTCDRCLQTYADERIMPFHILLAPLYRSERQREKHQYKDKELVKEDLEFTFYEGDRVDLYQLLREQLLLEKPIKNICQEDCKGICQKCGKNLNEGPCSCADEKESAHWSALKNFNPRS
ncbi:MAG: DUF177 domain-containing protein [Pseudomonadota bacterium]